MAVLTRRPKSGFVLYPKDAEKRVIDGTARFRTKCDVLVGPCACGGVHQETDEWVLDTLSDCGHSLETMVLRPADDGTVRMPRYWLKPSGHTDCDVIHGRCRCGHTHRANEAWVAHLLSNHCAVIEGCPAASEPVIGEHPTVEDNPLSPERAIDGCDCDACRSQRRRMPRRSRSNLDRRDI